MAVTFSATNKNTLITLSGGNLKMTSQSSSLGPFWCRIDTQITIDTYWEVKYTTFDADLLNGAGICNSTANNWASNGVMPGLSDALGVMCDIGGSVQINGATQASLGALVAGDSLSIALAPSVNLVWMAIIHSGSRGLWNGGAIGAQNPVGHVGGVATGITSYFGTGAVGGRTTLGVNDLQALASSFVVAAPSGYTAYDTGADTPWAQTIMRPRPIAPPRLWVPPSFFPTSVMVH